MNLLRALWGVLSVLGLAACPGTVDVDPLPGDAGSADSGSRGTLGLPTKDSFGSPVDVALIVLGHSTSGVGDWPGKLEQVLNANSKDGRHYVVFRLITLGDGGLLWAQLSFEPGDPQYHRVKACV